MLDKKNILLRFFFNKGWDYGHPNFKINKNFNYKNYYWSLIPKVNYKGKFINEIPVKKISGKYVYSVIDIAQYAIGCYELYLKNKKNIYRNKFLHNCNFLVEKQTKFKGLKGTWPLTYDVSLYNIKNTWISALGQGLGISALCRAYLETKKNKYLEAALQAYNVLVTPKEKGGVKEKRDNIICYEEYPTKELTFVLNGHISALWGINDLLHITKEKRIKMEWEKVISSLEYILDNFDIGYWTRYDLNPNFLNIASYFYHDLHIKQMKILHRLSGANIFLYYYRKWLSYQNNLFYKTKAFINKSLFKIMAKGR